MQTSVDYMKNLLQFPGVPDGLVFEAETGKNDRGNAVQVHSFVITAAVDNTTYTISLAGVAVAVLSAAAGATTQSIRDQLVAAIRARAEFDGLLTAYPFSANSFRVVAIKAGTGFAATESDGNITNSAIQANGTPESIPFGRAVVARSGGGAQSVTLPSAVTEVFRGVLIRVHSNVSPENANSDAAAPFSDLSLMRKGRIHVEVDHAVAEGADAYFRFATGGDAGAVGTWRSNSGGTAQADRITLGGATNSARYEFFVNGIAVEYNSDGSATADEIVQGLTDDANLKFAEHGIAVLATADLANDRVDLVSTDAGNPFVTQLGNNPTTNMVLSQVTANVGPRALKVKGKFRSATTGPGRAILEINYP